MTRRRASQPSLPAAPSRAPDAGMRPGMRAWLLGGLTAIYVARPLAPTEAAAATGSGVLFIMLSIMLAAGWLVWAIARCRLVVRLAWADAAFAALVLWHSVSALAAMGRNAPRPALNMLWEWVALALGFFLLRQLVRSRAEQRALAAVMVALAVAVAGFGLDQYFYSMPATRAEYQSDKEKGLREAGIDLEDRVARLRFEQRLAGTEPMGTFALPNSLAGFLAAWLVVAVGIGCWRWTATSASAAGGAAFALGRWVALGEVLIAIPIAACLLLTKSRAGYLAVLAGSLLVAASMSLQARRPIRRAVMAAAMVAAGGLALFTAAFASGALDAPVISEAAKSMSYRGQYWQAAMAMIAQRPWLGCGPGSFQDCYTLYKLPEASETIADPHNMFFEVWSTAGTPALVAFAALLVAAGWQCWRRRGESSPRPGLPTDSAPGAVIAGGGAGFVLALVVGSTHDLGLTIFPAMSGLVLATIIVAILLPWVLHGEMPLWIPASGAAALGVNLLAAGGIGFAGVAGSFWLLVGLAMLAAEAGRAWPVPRRFAVAALAAVLATAAAFFITGYLPITGSRLALLKAQNDWRDAPRHLADAARADPLDDEPWKQTALYHFARWRQGHDPRDFERLQQANGQVLRRRPWSSSAWRQAGDWYMAAYDVYQDRSYLSRAVAAYRRAVRRYPHQATLRALWADSLARRGSHAEAVSQARAALRLHDQTQHVDQKLDDLLQRRMVELRDGDEP